MVEENNNKEQVKKDIPDILTFVDKEKFRRKVVIATKLIGVGLVLAIVWFGWVNYSYAKEVNSILSEHGNQGFCYMCGLESLKKCECQYNYATWSPKEINTTEVGQNLAVYNIQNCLDRDLSPQSNLLNINNLTFEK